MDMQDIIALSLVAVAAVYAGSTLWRTLNGKSGCASHCGCGNKPIQSDASPVPSQRGLKRTPFVTLGQVGKPVPYTSTDEPD